jgi:hypothetical protein
MKKSLFSKIGLLISVAVTAISIVACSNSSNSKKTTTAIEDARTSYNACVRRLAAAYGQGQSVSCDYVYGNQAMSLSYYISYYGNGQYSPQIVNEYFTYLVQYPEQEIRLLVQGWNATTY